MFANGTDGVDGPFDGIVTLNSAAAFQFNRPPNGNHFDAQYFTEHEIDEVLGFGSRLNLPGTTTRPQDLFSWSARGVRNTTSIAVRYFSINGGTTNIVNFNQNPNFEFGDWSSRPCPQAHPFVQNAFGCPGQFSDVTATSPEGVNLDVIGYDLASSPTTDVNGDGKPDFLLYNTNTRGTAAWYMNNNVFIEGAFGPALPAGWILVSAADFNRDGHPDYALFKPNMRQTVVWYFSGVTRIGSASGPTPPSGWALVATGDFNSDVKPDYVLYNASTRQTVVWFMNNNVRVGSAIGPTLPAGWSVVGVADFNGDGKSDYLLFNPTTRQTAILYLSGTTLIGSAYGPTIVAGYNLIGTADFDGNGKPDYLLVNPSTRRTALWYLNNNVRIGTAFGPTLPGGWTVEAP
jgi:FG-GAP-like repeat